MNECLNMSKGILPDISATYVLSQSAGSSFFNSNGIRTELDGHWLSPRHEDVML